MSVVEMFGITTLVALSAAVLVFVTAMLRDPHSAGVGYAELEDPDTTELESQATPRS